MQLVHPEDPETTDAWYALTSQYNLRYLLGVKKYIWDTPIKQDSGTF